MVPPDLAMVPPETSGCPDDDTTEVCGVRILNSDRHLNILNIYRPPIRNTEEDEREDRFDPRALPVDETTLLVGDVNAHHPLWDAQCEAADRVGQRIADWMDEVGWLPLNSGEPTHSSYRSGSSTAPDLAACSSGLARRASWRLGPDLGSDHLPMVVSVRTTPGSARRIRKTKPAFHKADWVAFREECEAALSEPPAPRCTAQSLATKFTEVLQRASGRHIPSGARADPKPWALDPELQLAIAERREARQLLRQDDPDSRVRWIAAKRRAAEVEQRVSRTHFREFVETTLNKPASLGRVSKILKKWEGASDDHRPGEAMTHNGRLLASDKEKAAAFIQTYAHVSRQVRVPKLDKEAKHKWTHNRPSSCRECHGSRCNSCSEFTPEELQRQLQKLHMKKAPGPDGIANEHLRHLGPVAQGALLDLINASWRESSVPHEWKNANIIPIPKSGKDKRMVTSYRPIALTSHVSKLVERMVLARLTLIAEEKKLIPAEQVGFRAGRSVEDSLGRLVQQVQDGWNRPKARRKNPEEGSCAQKYVLLAFDFSRAYDTVDHRLLRVRLLEQDIPLCFISWIWQFLRDRRARVELNGTYSDVRAFRAGLPQGSVLSPTLFLLWSAPLVAALQRVPGTTAYMYADDTAALCAANDIKTAKERAQRAADALSEWARSAKMQVAGEKTQALVLSQWARDATDCSLRVAGKIVSAGDHLKLLGVTIDRLLHFGPHCRNLRQRVRPRTAQLRRLTGRDWGLEERQLRTIANGYVRGAIEHAAAAWLPATSPAHATLLEREMRAAARVITGCPISTPSHAVMAEAGLAPVAERRLVLAARLLAKAHALPEGDPLRACATWCWTDGSASGGITDGGAGAFIERPDGEVTELRIAAGRLCSSYRAEMIALQAAADYLTDNPAHEEDPIIFCTDSMAALARLREGPTAQTTPLGIQIWRAL
ncbi:putative RNA-directed DNA polymerase from transposon BS [Amphibalanus amphitrite]|uniref:Putative RNA-directed DNA polymerase from transposon BS n=1 Tax=Amphibalanus amphitrite TaxID=1232801 RepID=A0A6A4WAJ6_AMPAM|nr:putative RNA-directed DNA polymerase from transposon BS [Amphibalanus amphitrite]